MSAAVEGADAGVWKRDPTATLLSVGRQIIAHKCYPREPWWRCMHYRGGYPKRTPHGLRFVVTAHEEAPHNHVIDLADPATQGVLLAVIDKACIKAGRRWDLWQEPPMVQGKSSLYIGMVWREDDQSRRKEDVAVEDAVYGLVIGRLLIGTWELKL